MAEAKHKPKANVTSVPAKELRSRWLLAYALPLPFYRLALIVTFVKQVVVILES